MIGEIERLSRKNSLETYDLSFLENPSYGGWRIEKDTCQFLGRVCETFRPRHVLEFGTGLSTIILAHEASKGNIEKIWSIDHLIDFYNHPRKILERNCHDRFVNFLSFPLKLTFLAGKIFQFYSMPKDFFKEIRFLDLVIIDGPPYYYNGREAALYLVYPYLSQRGLVVLDDANRENREQVYFKNWKDYFGENIDGAIFKDEFKKGLACIWPSGRKAAISNFKFIQRLKDSSITLKCEFFRILRNLRSILKKDYAQWIL